MSRIIKLGIVHHSAGREDVTVAEVTREHVARGFRTIGYHYLVHRIGKGGPWTVSVGRPESEVGAHDEGENADSIGVCIAGDYTRGPVDPAGWSVLLALLANISRRHGLTNDLWTGHGEHEPAGTPTACPGFAPSELRWQLGVLLDKMED